MDVLFYISIIVYLSLNTLNGCDFTCETVAGFYIENVQSISRGSILLTITDATDSSCKRMELESGATGPPEDCSLYTDDIETWKTPDIDPTSTSVTSVQNNFGTVTVSITRNSESFDVANIPFDSTKSELYYQYWTVNSLFTTFIMLSDGMSSISGELYAIEFGSQSSNTYTLHSVTVTGYNFHDTDGHEVYVYDDYNILKVPIVCCLCVQHKILSYQIDTSNTNNAWLLTISAIVDDAVVVNVDEKLVWWDRNCPGTTIDVYDVTLPEQAKQTYTPDLGTATPTVQTLAPTAAPTTTVNSILGICDNNCQSFYDGCNGCQCALIGSEMGSTACTERWCSASATSTAYCKECVSDQLYFLRELAGGCAGEFIHCDSRFIGAPCGQGTDRSYCQCPSEYPFFVESSDGGRGCIKSDDCLEMGETLESLPIDFFEYPRAEMSECEYVYNICYSDSQCEGELICNVPSDSYSTCVPLFCNLDDNCDLIENDNCLMDDCLGDGWGYCATDDKLFNPNHSSRHVLEFIFPICIFVAFVFLI